MADDYPDLVVFEEEAVAPASPFSIVVPDTFTPPEDYEEGKPFDAVVSMVLQNGNLTLKAINDAELAPEAAEDAPSDEEQAEATNMDMLDDEMAEQDDGAELASEIQNFKNQ